MATVSATRDFPADWTAEPSPAASPRLRVSSNPLRREQGEAPAPAAVAAGGAAAGGAAAGGAAAGGAAALNGAAGGAAGGATVPATHRRRSRWFELNPGCFGRAALLAAGLAGGLAAGGAFVWILRWAWRDRRARRLVRMVRTASGQRIGRT